MWLSVNPRLTASVQFIIIWIFFNAVQGQFCPSEKSKQLGSLITWYTSEPKSVISDPPCINDRFELTRRTCTDAGRWVPPKAPYCRLIQRTYTPKCPYDFIAKNGYCIYVSRPRSMRRRCPFHNDLLITEHLDALRGLEIEEFWLPVRRNQPYGKFVGLHPKIYGAKYEHSYLRKAVKKAEEIEDCIIVTRLKEEEEREEAVPSRRRDRFFTSSAITYETKIVSCSSKYRQICIYDRGSTFSPSTPYATCLSGGGCYALAVNESRPPRGDFCEGEKLATAPTRLENYMIKTLVKDETCWIGLKRNKVQMFQWERTKDFLEFTDWNPSTDFRKPFAAIGSGGWELLEKENLTCGVCEVDLDKVEINLTLKPIYSRSPGFLVLTVYSPKFFINEDKIVCSTIGFNDVNLSFQFMKINTTLQGDREVYFLLPSTPLYNYYTCSGLVLPNGTEIHTEKVLFGRKLPGNEYALQMTIEDFCSAPKKCDPLYNDDLQEVINRMNDTLFEFIRPMKVVDVRERTLEIVLHVYVKENNMSSIEEYTAVESRLQRIFSRQKKTTIVSLKSVFGCMEHVSQSGSTNLHWDFTDIGSTTMPRELCFNSSGLPVTKTCLGDYISGVEWTEPTGTCSEIEYSLVTRNLHDIYLSFLNYSIDEIVSNLTHLTSEKDLRPGDIYYVSQILKGSSQIFSNFTNYNNVSFIVDNTVALINNLIGTDAETLKLSTELLNSTNVILDASEKLLGEIDINLNEEGILQVVSPYLFFQVSNVSLNGITGVVMRGPPGAKSFLDYTFEPLTSTTEIKDLLQVPDLEVASFIPHDIIEDMNGSRVYISIFYNNSLFVEDTEQGMEPGSKIISVSIMGYENYLISPIPVLFRKDSNRGSSCSYWRFGHSTYEEKYPARWAQDGGTHWNISADQVEVCGFTHLTHFALLLGEPLGEIPGENFEYHDRILSVITAVGCVLSLLGILVIVLTAILFKSWREKTGTKVLLNLSASVVLEMVVIFLADTKHVPSGTKCVILGCILHYATIASFCWMLVVAYLQYLRFVVVFSGIRPHLVLKSCLIGWVLPLLPVGSLLLWDANSYNPMVHETSSGLCYPHGTTAYITVLLPIATILLINVSIFCIVIYSITQKTVSSSRNKSLKYNQLKLAILLFFLLGLTWIFGFLTVFNNCLVCLYLFCSTATAQGFVLFVFYVLLDANTRKLWVNMLQQRFRLGRRKNTRLSNSSTTQESGGNGTNIATVSNN